MERGQGAGQDIDDLSDGKRAILRMHAGQRGHRRSNALAVVESPNHRWNQNAGGTEPDRALDFAAKLAGRKTFFDLEVELTAWPPAGPEQRSRAHPGRDRRDLICREPTQPFPRMPRKSLII